MDTDQWMDAMRANQGAYDLVRPRLTKYIPVELTPKQRAFMMLPHREAFFGGAAGGGKSVCLLCCALQYVDVPGYNALILRKTLKDADNPESILFKARRWLGAHPEVGWWPRQFTYLFPSGATLQFGYLDKLGDEFQYDSAEYQYIGFDELTHFAEKQYEYMFSRLRGPRCPIHPETLLGEADGCPRCKEIGPLARVPLRMCAASNPGGPGHRWVRDRFKIQAVPGKTGPTGKQLYAGQDPARPHIPSFMDDNPYIDKDAYRASLGQMKDLVTQQQKEAGNWGIQEEGRFKAGWIKRYRISWPYINLADRSWHIDDQCYQFLIVDAASSVKDAPGGVKMRKDRDKSWTSIGRWLTTPFRDLALLRAWRGQIEIPEILEAIKKMMEKGLIQFVGMEYSTQSIHLYQMLCNAGLPMRAFTTGGKDKIARSGPAQNLMLGGKLWLPYPGPKWLQEYEDELLTWTGAPNETDDQIDMTSYAAIHVTQEGGQGMLGLPEVM